MIVQHQILFQWPAQPPCPRAESLSIIIIVLLCANPASLSQNTYFPTLSRSPHTPAPRSGPPPQTLPRLSPHLVPQKYPATKSSPPQNTNTRSRCASPSTV